MKLLLEEEFQSMQAKVREIVRLELLDHLRKDYLCTFAQSITQSILKDYFYSERQRQRKRERDRDRERERDIDVRSWSMLGPTQPSRPGAHITRQCAGVIRRKQKPVKGQELESTGARTKKNPHVNQLKQAEGRMLYLHKFFKSKSRLSIHREFIFIVGYNFGTSVSLPLLSLFLSLHYFPPFSFFPLKIIRPMRRV